MNYHQIFLKGKVKWAKVRQPDVYNGKEVGYTMNLYPNDDVMNEYIMAVNDVLKEAETDVRFNRKKFKNPRNGVREEDNVDGTTTKYIYLKAISSFEDKETGETTRRVLPIYDRYGKILPEDVLLGNGTEVEVVVQLIPYHFGANTCGITPRMLAIKVNKLVEYTGGNNYGFQFDVDNDTVTFTDSSSNDEEDIEGDF